MDEINEDDLHIPDDSRHDQHDALHRDLERLLYLVRWYLPDPSAPISDAFQHMSADDQAEARALLKRLASVQVDLEAGEKRRMILGDYARQEAELLDIVVNPGPLVDDNGVVTDPATGNPLPDEAIRAKARDELADVQRQRDQLAGLTDREA